MTNEEEKVTNFPSFEELLLKKPIYEEFDISTVEPVTIMLFKFYSGPVDAYCTGCKKLSIFKQAIEPRTFFSGSNAPMPSSKLPASKTMQHILKASKVKKELVHDEETFTIDLGCNRDGKHRAKFIFMIKGDILIKIGQYPSIADFQLPDLAKYDQVLDEDLQKEFARAIGLHAHGIGIGLFVYLRRIFENLIEQAHAAAIADPSWKEEIFNTSRMDEKIKMLASHLPDLLVKNAGIYSILSKGIHYLSDQECQEHFATIKLGIELILDEKREREIKQKSAENLTKEISKIQTKLK